MYVAHVGDSTVVMGMKQQPSDDDDECPEALVITDVSFYTIKFLHYQKIADLLNFRNV